MEIVFFLPHCATFNYCWDLAMKDLNTKGTNRHIKTIYHRKH